MSDVFLGFWRPMDTESSLHSTNLKLVRIPSADHLVYGLLMSNISLKYCINRVFSFGLHGYVVNLK